MPVCPNCGNQAAENAIFCDQCGTRLALAAEPPVETAVAPAPEPAGGVPEGVLICPSCGAENVPGEVFCDTCGEPLEAPEPVPSEAVPAAEAAPEAAPAVAPEEEVEIELETVLEAEIEPEVEVEAEVVEVPAAPAAAAAGEDTYCPVCGASISPGDTFCGTCGASLTEAAEEAAVAEEPVFAEVEETEAVLVEEESAEEPVVEPVIVEQEAAEEPVVEEEPAAETVIVEEAEAAILEAEPEPTVVEDEAAVPEAEQVKCPVCGANVVPGQRFCASCGAALPAAEQAVPAPAPAAIPAEEPAAPPLAAGPYLEVVDGGAHIPLVDQPELLIGRTDDISGIYPDVDLTPHGGEEGGVSRRHANLIHAGDSWYVVDLDSTNGTYVNGTEIARGVQVPVQDGDRISFGDAELVFHAP
jgi:predicted amidophosphoribosyltransferase